MHTADRLIPRKVTLADIDSVKARQKKVGKGKRDIALLERAEALWNKLDEVRRNRARGRRFAYGDQWSDVIEVNGERMTTREYLMRNGNVVLQSNQIKNKIESVLGILVKEQNEPIANARDREEQQYGQVLTEAMQANCDKNKMSLLWIKWMRDALIGGLVIGRESYDDVNGPDRRLDSWSQYVNPNFFFFDASMNDPKFDDAIIVGQFFDKSFEQVAAMFARSENDYALLKAIYPNQSDIFKQESIEDITRKNEEHEINFLEPYDPTMCRVYEIWTQETKPRIRLNDLQEGAEEIIDADNRAYRKQIRDENLRRQRLARERGLREEEIPYIIGDGFGADDIEKNGWFVDTFWYCRYLAPDGTILWEGESPYPDRSHPFAILAIPFVDGKIVGYFQDAIDHNIAINRAMILHDWLIRTNAKGVTIVPKDIVPKDKGYQDFAKSWTAIDDIVFVDLKPGMEGLFPKTFYPSASTFNVSELISTYKRLMDDSDAVDGALQGKAPYSGTSGKLYAQMVSNASTSLAALLEQFHGFMNSICNRKLKNIASFYTPDRFESIAGKIDGIFDNANLNFNELGDIEYDLQITQSTDTPVYRAIINDDAKEFLMAGLITFEEYLEIANVPYADKILQMRQARQAEMEAAQNGEIPSEQL